MVAYEGQLLKRKCFTFILGNITYNTHITSNYIINLAANQNQLDTLEILISQHLGWRSLTALSEETYVVHNLCRHVFFLWREPIYNDVEFMNLEFLSKKKNWQLKLWGYQSVEFICLNMIVFTRQILNNKGALLLPTGRAPRHGSSKWRQVLRLSVELLSNKKPSLWGDKETNCTDSGNRLETLISHMAGCQYDCFVTPTCDAIISEYHSKYAAACCNTCNMFYAYHLTEFFIQNSLAPPIKTTPASLPMDVLCPQFLVPGPRLDGRRYDQIDWWN